MIRTVGDCTSYCSTAALHWIPQNNFDCNENLHSSANPHQNHQHIHSKSFKKHSISIPLCLCFSHSCHHLQKSPIPSSSQIFFWTLSLQWLGGTTSSPPSAPRFRMGVSSSRRQKHQENRLDAPIFSPRIFDTRIFVNL